MKEALSVSVLFTMETLLNTEAVLQCVYGEAFSISVQCFEKSVCALGGQQELLRAEHSGKLYLDASGELFGFIYLAHLTHCFWEL